MRPARRDEAEALAALIGAALAEFRGLGLAWRLYERRAGAVLGRWETGEVLVAVRGGGLAGTVTFYADAAREGMGLPSEWAGFGSLAVRPEARHQGIGETLVAACLARAGARTVAIHSARPMQAALRLYVRAGFRRAPAFDTWASAVEGFDGCAGDVRLLGHVREPD